MSLSDTSLADERYLSSLGACFWSYRRDFDSLQRHAHRLTKVLASHWRQPPFRRAVGTYSGHRLLKPTATHCSDIIPVVGSPVWLGQTKPPKPCQHLPPDKGHWDKKKSCNDWKREKLFIPTQSIYRGLQGRSKRNEKETKQGQQKQFHLFAHQTPHSCLPLQRALDALHSFASLTQPTICRYVQYVWFGQRDPLYSIPSLGCCALHHPSLSLLSPDRLNYVPGGALGLLLLPNEGHRASQAPAVLAPRPASLASKAASLPAPAPPFVLVAPSTSPGISA